MSKQKYVQRNYRINHGEEYLSKERLRMKRKRANMTEAEKEEERRKARNRMQAKRKKEEPPNLFSSSILNSLLSPQTLGKAVKKAAKSLPRDKNLRVEVLQELCKRDNLTVIHRRPPQFIGNASRDAVHGIIEEFYLRDDISRQAPGLKDTCYVKDLKQKVRKI